MATEAISINDGEKKRDKTKKIEVVVTFSLETDIEEKDENFTISNTKTFSDVEDFSTDDNGFLWLYTKKGKDAKPSHIINLNSILFVEFK